MPSEKILQKKQEAVIKVLDKIKGAVAGVLVDYKGINVEKDTKLRSELRAAGVDYSVVKNSVLSRAFDEVGYGELKDVLEGSTSLALSQEDPVVAAKIIAKYSKELKTHFVIKAGFVDGRVIDVAEVTILSQLPSREELIAKAMGSLNAPISGLVNVLNGNIRGLVIALNQIAEQRA